MTVPSPLAPAATAPDNMIHIPGGRFVMGSDHHYPEEAPAHPVEVDAFWIDATPVTNRDFRRFVEATGHRTTAEIAPNPDDYPGAQPDMLRPASLVFTPTERPVPLHDWSQWWRYVFDADWRHPLGPDSSIDDLDDHPVVHVTYDDATAYAAWAGKALPTEAEWEFAARGGVDGQEFAWGDELLPDGKAMANFWQGNFPSENLLIDGYERTSPVGSFPANGYGLSDMIGNVWEWTEDFYAARHQADLSRPCCAPRNPLNQAREASYDPQQPHILIPRRVLKGGSHLCAPSYCRRYRPAARHAQAIDSSTSHIGFRCVIRAA